MRVKKTSSVKFAGQPKRGSIYQAVFDKMKSLKPGESLVLPLETENGKIDSETARNRLNAAIRRAGPPPPKGYRWSQRLTEDGGIAITPVKKSRRRNLA